MTRKEILKSNEINSKLHKLSQNCQSPKSCNKRGSIFRDVNEEEKNLPEA